MIFVSWTALILYALAALWLGMRAARREGAISYWDAGRALDAGSVGMSISAGFLSVSWSCVYAVQLFYWYGLGAAWLITIPWLLALGGIYLLAHRYRGLEQFSQPEMVGARFGRRARRQVALALAFVFLVWGGAEIYVAANLLSPSLGVSPALLIVLFGAIVAAYSMSGGFGAVVATDRLQYGLVTLYMLAMAWLTLRGLATTSATSGSWQLLWRIPPHGAKSTLPWTAWWAPGATAITLTFLAYLPGWLLETDLWLRVQAARDVRAARAGVGFAMLNALLFVGLLPAFIGISALLLFPSTGGAFPPEVGVEGDAIFAALMARYAPPWLALVGSVGLVAAAMSTIDTCTNVMALSLAYDVLAPDRAESRRIAARVTLASVIAACIFALNIQSLWDIFYLSSGILTSAVAFPVAAVLLPGVTARSVRYSSMGGLAVTILAYALEASGWLVHIEPAAWAEVGLGFVIWGLAGAALGAVLGRWRDAAAGRRP